MLKKENPKAAKRPLLTKNTPFKLVKATKKVNRKVGKMTTGISKKTNPIVYNPDNPNMTPGKRKYRFDPHAPPKNKVVLEEDGRTNRVSRLDSGVPPVIYTPIPNVSLPISPPQATGIFTHEPYRNMEDSSSKHQDSISKDGNLVAFPGKSAKKRVQALHIEQYDDYNPSVASGSAPPVYSPGELHIRDMPMPQAPAYQSIRSNISINPSISNRILGIRSQLPPTIPSTIGKRKRDTEHPPALKHMKTSHDIPIVPSVTGKRLRSAGVDTPNKKLKLDKTVLGKRGRGLGQPKGNVVKKRKVDTTPITVIGKRKRSPTTENKKKRRKL